MYYKIYLSDCFVPKQSLIIAKLDENSLWIIITITQIVIYRVKHKKEELTAVTKIFLEAQSKKEPSQQNIILTFNEGIIGNLIFHVERDSILSVEN